MGWYCCYDTYQQIDLVKKTDTNAIRVSEIQNKRKQLPDIKDLIIGILESDKTALSRAITLVESTKKEQQEPLLFFLGKLVSFQKFQ